MGGTPFSQEVFNTREEFVSSDANRLQSLLSRDVQDALAASARTMDTVSAIPGTTDLLRGVGTPVSSVDLAPTFTPSVGLTATIGAGSGYSYFTTGVTADYSAYQVLRWPSQTVTFSAGAGNPRVDIVYAAIGSAVSQTASRNILVDPVARTTAAQTVNKQIDPLSTIGVWAGTAAPNPVPDKAGLLADHPGAVPLFYVWVPAGASSASQFGVCRGIWRRTGYPFSAMNGVISGFDWSWDLTVDCSTTSATMIGGGAFHRIVINGEVMEFYANLDSRYGNVVADSTASPYATAAGSAGRVYYLYAVGGSMNPMPSFNTNDGLLSPITIVESTIQPNVVQGCPIANLTVNGVTVTPAGAAYVGLGYVYPSTANRGNCIQSGDMTYFGTSGGASVSHATTTTGFEPVTLPSIIPPFSTKVALIATTDGGHGIAVMPFAASGGIPQGFNGTPTNLAMYVPAIPGGSTGAGFLTGQQTVSPSRTIQVATFASGENIVFFVQGVNHAVRLVGPSC